MCVFVNDGGTAEIETRCWGGGGGLWGGGGGEEGRGGEMRYWGGVTGPGGICSSITCKMEHCSIFTSLLLTFRNTERWREEGRKRERIIPSLHCGVRPRGPATSLPVGLPYTHTHSPG